MKATVVVVVNAHLFTARHRLPVLEALTLAGWLVHVIAPAGSPALEELKKHGYQCYSLRLSRRGINPFAELVGLFGLRRLYLRLKPDVVYHATIKPVLYGSLAARFAGVPAVINAITGLGYIYTDNRVFARSLRKLVNLLYRFAFTHNFYRVIFQNLDDWQLLAEATSFPPENARLIPGSGVNTHHFKPMPEPPDPPVVILVARMLWEKGIGEFVKAAALLKQRGEVARLVLVGGIDPGNPSAITQDQLRRWHDDGVVEWWGEQDDMLSVYRQAHLVVLPSYREGLPKVLLEAAACGLPVVTTDSPGCRDAVTPFETGLLVPPQNAEALADAIASLITAPEVRRRMGKAGRIRVVEKFSTSVIVAETMGVFNECLG